MRNLIFSIKNLSLWLNEFVMDFGEGEQTTTYIDNITVEDNRESQVEGIFNLNGQRLDAPQKGINIINGRKVVIKWVKWKLTYTSKRERARALAQGRD